ncbi:MAG: alcohol dehydrogenase catalytic domain-containing protein, partial [Sulfitobacter sp.]|nr:alcohol dehydrogenase catalytic domain-containing protein [Sulfitobacter sp.]
MKAMLSHEPGGPETLKLTEMEAPAPSKKQVRIRIRAAGLNFPDTLIIKDMYQMKPPRPFAPGGEVAGEIEALGEGVEGLEIGDRVLAMTGFGGFATHLCIDAARVMKIPDAMPYDEASCLVLTYGTSHHALKNRAEIKAGESLLILGAAGGVGAAAIELGKAAGARVIAAVSSEEKAQFCRDLGADETIIYARDMDDRDAQKAFSAQIKEAAGG